jgi:hypothetical protein
MAIGGWDAVGSTSVGHRAWSAVGSGVDPGVAVEAVAGCWVTIGFVDLGLAVGLAVGFGAAFGLAVGLGVGLGFGVGAGTTTTVPGETLERVTVLAPLPDPLVAEKLYAYVPTARLRLTRKMTPAFQLDPDAVIGMGPTPEMTTTTFEAAQPALSLNSTAKSKSVDGWPLPGETVPPDRLG